MTQREIKFRVWDMYHEEMITGNLEYHMSITGNAIDSRGVIGINPAMQWTGLLDKHGNEIYEGDIIQLVNEAGELITVVCEYGVARREMKGSRIVEVDIPCFYFRLSNGLKTFPIVKNYTGKHDLELFEIIGNIYENPELL